MRIMKVHIPVIESPGKHGQGTLLLVVILSLLLGATNAFGQDISRTETGSMTFSDPSDPGNKLRAMNINGSLTIEAYDGQSVEMSVKETISGTRSEMEQGRQELEFKLEKRGRLILAYLDAPFVTLRIEDGKIHYHINRNEESYSFTHEVHLRVPRGILLEGSTINRGDLQITGSFREVKAKNINGAIELRKMTSKTEASTINGDISASYEKSPDKDSQYQTVNGSIRVYMPEDLSAEVYFKSLHGELFTDFENVEKLAPQVTKKHHSSRSKVSYRVEKFNPIRIGNGTIKLRFEVLNGDVYLRNRSASASKPLK